MKEYLLPVLTDASAAALQAVSMVGMIAYLSYLVAEHFGCSGIVAIFTCAVVMSHYALYNVPREMRKATRHTAEVFSYMCEGAIFLYVGLDTIDPVTWQVGFRLPIRLRCTYRGEAFALQYMGVLFSFCWGGGGGGAGLSFISEQQAYMLSD